MDWNALDWVRSFEELYGLNWNKWKYCDRVFNILVIIAAQLFPFILSDELTTLNIHV